MDGSAKAIFTTFGKKDYSFTYTFATSTIYHVVFRFNTDFSVDLYVNGSFQQTVTGTSAASATSDKFTIGAQGNGLESFAGIIDEVAVYATQLSATRIAAHYAASSQFVSGMPGFRYAFR